MASLALSIAAASPSLIHAEGPGADRRSEGSRASEPLPAERKASPQAREDRAPEAGALEDIVAALDLDDAFRVMEDLQRADPDAPEDDDGE